MGSARSLYSGRLDLARQAAAEAGRITLEYFRRVDLQVERKRDDSPVTIADRRAEEHLRKRIAESFPDDAVLGEELPEKEGQSGFRWILDPIDGTKSFIHGVPLYSTLIGVEHEGQPVIGLILIPALDECIYAARGDGAWYAAGQQPPSAARVSSSRELRQSLFLTSEVSNFRAAGRPEVYQQLEAASRLSRTWGDGYGYLMVATGRAELMVDPLMNVWDAAAILPVIEEAGGCFTDWEGLPSIRSGNGVACNRAILEQVLRITRKA